jgi:tripartite-type tricarboxylate transporter receptor subunit TctC
MAIFPAALRNAVSALLLLLAVLAPRTGAADEWPSRPITLVVSFPAGAIMDNIGRAIGRELTRVLGQPVVVENRTGGGGSLALTSVARAVPDGYTLLITAVGPAVLRPLMDTTVNYDIARDFAPVIMVGDSPNVVLSNPKLGFESVADLMRYAKQKPEPLTLGYPGPGTMGHLVGLLFAAKAGLKPTYVAYRGSTPLVVDLLGGQIDIGVVAFSTEHKAVKVLAAATERPVDFLPGVATLRAGGYPDVVASTWNAIFAPAGTPAAVVAKLNATIDAYLASAETRAQLAQFGLTTMGGTPAQLSATIAADRARWAEIIKAAQISLTP